MVVDELGDAVKGPAVETELDRGPVATVHDLVALDEGVVKLPPPEHAQGVGVGEGRVLPDEKVPFVVEEGGGVFAGQLPVEPRLDLEREVGVYFHVVPEAESGLHGDDAQVVRLVETRRVAARAPGVVVRCGGGGVGAVPSGTGQPLGETTEGDVARVRRDRLADPDSVGPSAKLLHLGRRWDVFVWDGLVAGGGGGGRCVSPSSSRARLVVSELLVVGDGVGFGGRGRAWAHAGGGDDGVRGLHHV